LISPRIFPSFSLSSGIERIKKIRGDFFVTLLKDYGSTLFTKIRKVMKKTWDYSQPRITRIYTNLWLGISQLNDFFRLFHHILRTKMLAFLKLEKFDKIKI